MKPRSILFSAIALVLTAWPAAAQDRRPERGGDREMPRGEQGRRDFGGPRREGGDRPGRPEQAPAQRPGDEAFRRFDTNGDGKIDSREFTEGMKAGNAAPRPRDGDRPRENAGPRDGERPRENAGPRDGERARETPGPRDGDRRAAGGRGAGVGGRFGGDFRGFREARPEADRGRAEARAPRPGFSRGAQPRFGQAPATPPRAPFSPAPPAWQRPQAPQPPATQRRESFRAAPSLPSREEHLREAIDQLRRFFQTPAVPERRAPAPRSRSPWQRSLEPAIWA